MELGTAGARCRPRDGLPGWLPWPCQGRMGSPGCVSRMGSPAGCRGLARAVRTSSVGRCHTPEISNFRM
jgi:hypothetical protein